MPSIYKATLLFRFRPDTAVQGTLIPGRVAGWSESFWFQQPLTATQFTVLGNTRVKMCAPDVQIVGWRQTRYDYAGNRLTPYHAQVGTLAMTGKSSGDTNSPEDTLRIRVSAAGVPITFTQYLHAIPDDLIESGEYVQSNQFVGNMNSWVTLLTGQLAGSPGAYWLGRDPTQVSQRVVAVSGNPANPLTIRTQASINITPGADYIRLRRVYDDAHKPIKGTFLCTAAAVQVDGTWLYTVIGLPNQTRSTPSGTARKDVILVSQVTAYQPVLLSSRKVGRPTSLYRGRRTSSR